MLIYWHNFSLWTFSSNKNLHFIFFLKIFIRYFLHLHFKCCPKSPLYPPSALLPIPPTPTSCPWHSPVLGHMIFARPRASPPIDSCLGHPLLHMQLETQFWGVLVHSYCWFSSRVADPFSSLGIFSSSFFRGPVFHPIDDCEHPSENYFLMVCTTFIT